MSPNMCPSALAKMRGWHFKLQGDAHVDKGSQNGVTPEAVAEHTPALGLGNPCSCYASEFDRMWSVYMQKTS